MTRQLGDDHAFRKAVDEEIKRAWLSDERWSAWQRSLRDAQQPIPKDISTTRELAKRAIREADIGSNRAAAKRARLARRVTRRNGK